ncbi:hypothetical protein ABZ215_38595 [Amycolatopsis sp. NPDC006131]|uniref:hypothetical protein n=1 Tax=Amycolatopsis sp. NPDC006131 TaxID=3156731 RepID=UPI0033BC78F6
MTVQWQGYIEHHEINAPGRKAAGRAARLSAPGETLTSVDEVVAWLKAKSVEAAKTADQQAAEKNNLVTHPENIYRSLARKGQSLYASVHVTGREVVDVCVEAVTA